MENTNTQAETTPVVENKAPEVKPPTLAQRAEGAFKTARNAAIAKNGFTKFAEAEQLYVIEAMVGFLQNDKEAQVEGFDAIQPFIQAVANASAYAQLLDKHGKITRATRGSGGSKAAFI